MKSLSLVCAAAVAFSAPAFAETKKPGTPDANATRQYDPGAGGQSKAGVPGQPGNKSGPAVDKNSGGSAGTGSEGSGTGVSGSGTAGSDNGKVPGTPGNKSGPSLDPSKGVNPGP